MILWCGGEEIDFPTRSGFATSTAAGGFRAGYARGSVSSGSSASAKTSPLAAPISSAWLTFRNYRSSSGTNNRECGLGKSGTNAFIGIGCGSATNKIALLKYDGTTTTRLAEESGTLYTQNVLCRVDIQIVSYAASGQARVYLDGNLVIDYSGDLTVLSQTTLDDVRLNLTNSGNAYYSEIILADEDTRLFSLTTLAPNGAGDANAWTGAYTTVDEAVLDDADVTYTDTADQDALFGLSNLPAGNFVVKAVKVAARASKSATGITSVKLGVKTNSTVDVGGAIALDTAWATKERLMAQNPVTSNNWSTAEIDALQLALRSAT